MSSLQQVLASLQHEIDAALAAEDHATFRAQRLTVTLELAIETNAKSATLSFTVPPKQPKGATRLRDGQRPHTITIEFERVGSRPLGVVPADGSSSEAMELPGDGAPVEPVRVPSKNLIANLTRMFGEPGFDNAARATVFREIIEGLRPRQIRALLSAFAQDPGDVASQPIADPVVASARNRIARLLKFGPGGTRGGVAAMARVFQQNPVDFILRVVRERWKSQEDWIQTGVPA